jgi:hypothetical protein
MKTIFFKKLITLTLSVFSITAFAQCPTITNLNVTLGANGTATINPVLTGTVSVFNSDYLWQVSPSASQTSYSWSQQGTFSFPANGSYTVCLTYIDSTTMCSSNQYCSVVNISNYVGPPCNAAFYYYTDVNCITHFNNTSTGSSLNYLWDINGTSYTVTSPTVNLPNGNFNATLKTLSGGLVCDSASSNVAVSCTPGMTTCNANYSYYTDSNCVTHFINSSTGSNLTYQWYIAGFSSSAINPTVTLSNGNHYVVFYTYSSGVRCDSIKYMISISCTSVTPNCNANAAFSSYTDSTTCITHFTNQSTGSNLTYAWYDLSTPTPVFLASDTSFITILSYNINTIGLYVYTSGQLCDSAINQVYLSTACSTSTIAPTNCQANSSFYLFADSLNAGNYFAYNFSSATGNVSYSWDFGDGTPPSTQQYPFHQYAIPGQYIVCLTVTGTYTNAFGAVSTCTNTYCDSSSVQRMAAGFQMSQINVISQTTTGLKQANIQTTLIAYPNPITDELTIETTSEINQKLTYILVDALGRIVLTNDLNNTKTTINTSDLGKGFYNLSIINENGNHLKTIKLIK